jgi:hypothetical protein
VDHQGGGLTDAAERGTALSPDGSRLFPADGGLAYYRIVAYGK